jgi:two-component system sensor histidine kinase/response regulator
MLTFEARESKILIVDDVPKNIQVVGNILSQERLKIAYATNGESALKLAFNNDFDLILLDVMMPGMDGFEVCRQLRANKNTMDLPVIFLSAKSDLDSVLTGFQLGAQDYVSKPFNASELIARVRTHLDLREKKHQLKLLNQHLEEKVKERTSELELANLRLSRLEKAKSEFLGIISHELRTPLNGIIGLTQLLNQTDINDEQRRYLEFLEQTSKRLSRFSETALLITSLQAEHQKVEFFQTSIRLIFTMAAEELKNLIDEKEIKLYTEFSDTDIQIVADSDLIRKSVTVLLENCIYHLPKHGTITVKTFSSERGNLLEISDNGPGFDEELLDHFNQPINKNFTEVSEGVGLSIAAVKLIMDAHNGILELQNKPQNGAIFRLIFEKQP